ncbi:redoxin domain-containing protein [Streptomyces agglomeratus]|uniref:Redoxin domain-containing protein n=1 Tax=Streptomyces agglomeratus TaxID=285458 RepID=A0A1E5NZA3_9ACTN|nr:TlpA disulfide reductase family protein [Streptomyces agglomeratus]OEJ21511.1 redoxin domain-containing protein [Streptomyces agglomeratus]
MSLSRAPQVALLTALVTVAALSLSSCSEGAAGKSSGGDQTELAAGGEDLSSVPKSERRLPNDLKGETLHGKRLDIADYKGKVVVINVWGSWCPPCRAEAPSFAKVAKETKAQGVEFVGINTRDNSREPAIAFENDYGVDYDSLYDPNGNLVLNGFPKGSLNPQAIPSTIVLDRGGKIAARALRPLSGGDLRRMIDPLIAEK